MIITLNLLKSKNACKEQLDQFQELFGNEVKVTKKLCIKYKDIFDFDWAAENLLSNTARDKYYVEIKPAWGKYYAETKSALDKYDAETKPALDKYDAETKPAWDKYCKAKAIAFYNASKEN